MIMFRRSLPSFELAFSGKYRYTKRASEAEAFCREIIAKNVAVLGVDAEWNAVYRRGKKPGKTALL